MSETAVQSGWCASLELRLDDVAGVTRIAHRRHEGPLVVQRAFYPERAPSKVVASTGAVATVSMAEPCHIYIVHPPGGVASGDELNLDASAGRGSHALFTTPAAGKFYRRGAAGVARLAQRLKLNRAVVEWLPQENIFYPDAAAELSTVVRLSRDSRFIGWEIGCYGLPASARTLERGTVRQGFELWLDGSPVFLERLTVEAAALSAGWGLAGQSAMGTWLAYPAGAAELQAARAIVAATCGALTAACTLVDDVLVCRTLGDRSDRVKQVFVELWQALRPALVGREAVLPRVWAT
jgi:urease accessory protein